MPPRIPRRRRQRPPNCNESRVAVSGIISRDHHRDLPTTTRDLLPFFFFSVWRFITLFGEGEELRDLQKPLCVRAYADRPSTRSYVKRQDLFSYACETAQTKVPRCRVHDVGGLTITMTRQADDVCVCVGLWATFSDGVIEERAATGAFGKGLLFVWRWGKGVRFRSGGFMTRALPRGLLSPSAELFTRRGISV